MALLATARPHPLADELRLLDRLPHPALLVDPGGIILHANDAWEQFARENGGGEFVAGAALVGTRWLDHVSGEWPRRLHEVLLERAARRAGAGPRGGAIQLAECNTPTTARLVATHLEPVLGPGRMVASVAVSHRLVRQRPIAEVYPPVDAPGSRWTREDGTVEQCSCCRRVRRPDAEELLDPWEFAPGLVAEPPPGTRFVYCALCLELHHPAGAGAGADGAL